jgi:hypothetical protein
MSRPFVDRLKELSHLGSDDVAEKGSTLGVWMSSELLKALETLASDVGITRSAMARELLTVAIEQAARELLESGVGTQLDLIQAPTPESVPTFKRLEARRISRRAVREKATTAPPKRAVKPAKGRSRAKG